MQTHGGKGSTQRPTLNRKQFEDNFGNLYYSNELTNFIHYNQN
jgi:hypothetical protein